MSVPAARSLAGTRKNQMSCRIRRGRSSRSRGRLTSTHGRVILPVLNADMRIERDFFEFIRTPSKVISFCSFFSCLKSGRQPVDNAIAGHRAASSRIEEPVGLREKDGIWILAKADIGAG